MDALFHELLQTIQEARVAVKAELDLLLRADILNRPALLHLQGQTAELVGQAESLARIMQSYGADEAPVRGAEKLCVFFKATEDQVASLLGGGQCIIGQTMRSRIATLQRLFGADRCDARRTCRGRGSG